MKNAQFTKSRKDEEGLTRFPIKMYAANKIMEAKEAYIYLVDYTRLYSGIYFQRMQILVQENNFITSFLFIYAS